MDTRPQGPRERRTKDLAFAAYCHMQGLRVISGSESRRGMVNEYEFVLDDPNGAWNDLMTSFANSDALRFDNSVRTLKKLCKR